MKIVKILTTIAIAVVLFGLGYWYGSQTWTSDGYHFNTEEARLHEIEYANALLEGLHWYMANDATFWKETFMFTSEYENINKLNGGDWEDFYLY